MFHTSGSFTIGFVNNEPTYADNSANVENSLKTACHPESLMPLQKTNQLFIRRLYEKNDTHLVYNAKQQQIFIVLETSRKYKRLLCGQRRNFVMVVLDNSGGEVLFLERPFRSGCYGFLYCQEKMRIFTSSGEFLGVIKQSFNLLRPNFFILDAKRMKVRSFIFQNIFVLFHF